MTNIKSGRITKDTTMFFPIGGVRRGKHTVKLMGTEKGAQVFLENEELTPGVAIELAHNLLKACVLKDREDELRAEEAIEVLDNEAGKVDYPISNKVIDWGYICRKPTEVSPDQKVDLYLDCYFDRRVPKSVALVGARAYRFDLSEVNYDKAMGGLGIVKEAASVDVEDITDILGLEHSASA